MNSSKMHPLQTKSLLIFVSLLALLSCAIIALNGCGPSDEERITETLTTELETIKSHDDQFISSLVSEDTQQALQNVNIDAKAFCTSLLDGFDYQINSIEVNKDTAQASVTITCKNLSDATSTLKSNAEASSANGTGTNLTDDELSQTIAENSLDYLQNTQPKQYDPITISLLLQDKKWEVDQQAKSAFAQLLL